MAANDPKADPSVFVTPGLTRGLPCLFIGRWNAIPEYIFSRGHRMGRLIPELLRTSSDVSTSIVGGYTKDYGIKRLVWFERHDRMESAILREKRIKRWLRAWKYDLIITMNPTWRDLAENFGFEPLPLGTRKAGPGSSPG